MAPTRPIRIEALGARHSQTHASRVGFRRWMILHPLILNIRPHAGSSQSTRLVFCFKDAETRAGAHDPNCQVAGRSATMWRLLKGLEGTVQVTAARLLVFYLHRRSGYNITKLVKEKKRYTLHKEVRESNETRDSFQTEKTSNPCTILSSFGAS